MPTYYDTLVRTQQLQELRTMPTYYDTLVHAPAAAGVEEDAHLLWLWRGRWGSSCRGSAEVEDDAHLHLHGLVAIPATKRFVNTLRSATAREPGKQLQGICRQLRTMPTCYGNICIHPQVEYSVRGEAAVVGELQAVKNDAHLLLHGLVALPIPVTEKMLTYPQVGYGVGCEEAVAGDLQAGIGSNAVTCHGKDLYNVLYSVHTPRSAMAREARKQLQGIWRQGLVAMATSTVTFPTTDSRMIREKITPVYNQS
jgi:hypothetical protein